MDLINNKKGEEFVEAAIILPLIFLIILGTITIMLYLFQIEKEQSKMHIDIIKRSSERKEIIGIERSEKVVNGEIQGLSVFIMSKKINGRAYVLNPSKGIRLGELLSHENDKNIER